MNGARYLLMGVMLFFLAGCPSRRVVTKSEILKPEMVNKKEMFAIEADGRLLRERVILNWQAKVAEDWNSVLDLYEPRKRISYTATVFAEYGTEPVNILSFTIKDIVTEDDLAWVWIEYDLTLLRYDILTPITMQVCEKWRHVGGNWYLIPTKEAIIYPESPILRNHTEEQTLRTQFEKSWVARKRSDWAKLYRMIDPRDHEDLAFDDYAHSEDEFRYLRCKVGWVEVIGDRGRVLVTYHRRLTDKNMKNARPIDTTIIEHWIKTNGAWYLDWKL